MHGEAQFFKIIPDTGIFVCSCVLNFGDFEPGCSYKIVFIKKECVLLRRQNPNTPFFVCISSKCGRHFSQSPSPLLGHLCFTLSLSLEGISLL